MLLFPKAGIADLENTLLGGVEVDIALPPKAGVGGSVSPELDLAPKAETLGAKPVSF